MLHIVTILSALYVTDHYNWTKRTLDNYFSLQQRRGRYHHPPICHSSKSRAETNGEYVAGQETKMKRTTLQIQPHPLVATGEWQFVHRVKVVPAQIQIEIEITDNGDNLHFKREKRIFFLLSQSRRKSRHLVIQILMSIFSPSWIFKHFKQEFFS